MTPGAGGPRDARHLVADPDGESRYGMPLMLSQSTARFLNGQETQENLAHNAAIIIPAQADEFVNYMAALRRIFPGNQDDACFSAVP